LDVFREFSVAQVVMRTTLLSSLTSLSRISLEQDFLGAFFSLILGAPAVIRATLEQIPLREILLLEEIQG
jgi:hypothetical protein